MTMDEIIIVVTALVTLIFGEIAKRLKWVKSKYIPYQNLVIGILAGLLVYFTGLCESPVQSIITCLCSALCAGGTYDLTKTKAGE